MRLFVIGKPYKEMDEMERMIELKSIKWAWYFQIIYLLCWFMYKGIYRNEVSYWLLFLIFSQALIQFIVKFVCLKKMCGGGDEKQN